LKRDVPTLWGTGCEVMFRIAAPMVSGMISSMVLTLAMIPAIYALVKRWRLARGVGGNPGADDRILQWLL